MDMFPRKLSCLPLKNSELQELLYERIGGQNYEDIASIVEEQESTRGEMPGPVPDICSDIIVDDL